MYTMQKRVLDRFIIIKEVKATRRQQLDSSMNSRTDYKQIKLLEKEISIELLEMGWVSSKFMQGVLQRAISLLFVWISSCCLIILITDSSYVF